MREVRIYVRYVRDLFKSLDSFDVFNGVDCNFLFFLSVFIDGDLGGAGGIGVRGWVEGLRVGWLGLIKGLRVRFFYLEGVGLEVFRLGLV